MSQLTKLAKQTAIYGIPTIVSRFLNYFLTPLYAYNLATYDYGVISELYSYIALLMVVLTYGMETSFFRYSQHEKHSGSAYGTAFGSLIISTLFFLILALGLTSPVASGLGYIGRERYLRLAILILGLDALRAIPFAYLRGQQKAMRFALIKTIDIMTNISFNLFFILLCPFILQHTSNTSLWHKAVSCFFNPDDLLFYIFLSNLLASMISLLLLMPEFRRFRWRMDKKQWSTMFKYGFPIMIGGLAGMINETFDRVVLKYLITIPKELISSPELAKQYAMSQLGIYGACYKAAMLISLFIQAYRFAAEPFFFSKMRDKDAKQTYADAMKYMVIFLSIVFLGIMLYIDLIAFMVDKPYREGMRIVPVLLLANIFLGTYYNISIWYKVTDKTHFGAYISLIGAVITLVLNIILVPLMGYMGAAWATFFCYLVIMILAYFFGQKYYPVPYPVLRTAGYVLAAVILWLLSTLLSPNNVVQRYIVKTLFFLSFVVGIYFFEFRKTLPILLSHENKNR